MAGAPLVTLKLSDLGMRRARPAAGPIVSARESFVAW
jgi:hypothetical protein